MAEQQARVTQYVAECVVKATNVVLQARVPSSSAAQGRDGRRSWVRPASTWTAGAPSSCCPVLHPWLPLGSAVLPQKAEWMD